MIYTDYPNQDSLRCWNNVIDRGAARNDAISYLSKSMHTSNFVISSRNMFKILRYEVEVCFNFQKIWSWRIWNIVSVNYVTCHCRMGDSYRDSRFLVLVNGFFRKNDKIECRPAPPNLSVRNIEMSCSQQFQIPNLCDMNRNLQRIRCDRAAPSWSSYVLQSTSMTYINDLNLSE